MANMTVSLRWGGPKLTREQLVEKATAAVQHVKSSFEPLDVRALQPDVAKQFVQLTIKTDADKGDFQRMAAMLREQFGDPAAAASTAAKPRNEKGKAPKTASKSGGRSRTMSAMLSFFGNFLRADSYKPQQGWYARLWTALGLGALVLAGVYRLYETQLRGEVSLTLQYSVPVVLLAVLGWIVYRLVQYPPFVDFLTATEAEMNKVSWTSKADLRRATLVVLSTVFLMSVYLFAVDRLWVTLLQLIRVLNIGDVGDFGSQAG